MARSTKGNCYLCGAELGKTAMKNHLLLDHGEKSGQECRLLRIECAYDKKYWLYVDIPVDKTLNALDKFLRRIWLECCGHMSEFRGVGKNAKVGSLREGDQFLHLYDFGDTTETLITVIGTTWRPPQREAVRLLSRNVPPKLSCSECGAPAEYVDTERSWSDPEPFYCKKCAKKYADEEMLLPVTNSPRMGVCGYTGELDTFAFIPPKCPSVPRKKPSENARRQPETGVTGLYPDELYELAFAFRNAKPWNRLFEDELFAIPLPNGETGYCSVMGAAGKHFALAVYPGERGLRGLQRILEREDAFNPFEMLNRLKVQEYLLSQLYVQCSFENKDEMLPEELSSARAYAASHGIKFRGANSFPDFMVCRPAAYPARILSQENLRILCQALRTALAVNAELADAPQLKEKKASLGFSTGHAAARTLPVVAWERDGWTWHTEMLPEFGPPVYPRPVLRDDILLARLKRTRKRNTVWACDVAMCPQPIRESEDEVPVFPYLLLTVDKGDGTALTPAMVRNYEEEAETLLHNLGERMLEICVPRRIIVTDDRTHAFLESLTASLGIELVQTDGDDLLEDLEEEFADFSIDGGLSDLSGEDAAELAAGLLMDLDDSVLLQLPQAVWENLYSAVSQGNVPPEVRARIRALDKKRSGH